ncbi:MAG: hypothetical protein CSA07_03695 [Bacteroidia bacterium]|nr:MAG: hypothetical protein CSA07_03695 [Bacteroidia bacterium]
MPTYVNPFTDFGFKRLFGEEASKDLLISFLNGLLEGEQVIRDLQYLRDEHLGITPSERKAIFDIYCENERGEKFIVELQRAGQKYFRDRTIFYSTFPIREQARRNKWDFRLGPVYTIAILDFVLDDDIGPADMYRYDVKLMETKLKEVFFDRLTYIYLIMPKFNKGLDELETLMDKWLYAIKHLYELQSRPSRLSERVFERFFEQANIAQFSLKESAAYEESLKAYRDWKNILDNAREKGRAEGKKEGKKEGRMEEKREVARAMLAEGIPAALIARITGLPEDTVRGLE